MSSDLFVHRIPQELSATALDDLFGINQKSKVLEERPGCQTRLGENP
jgi:hypothetical protein